MAGRVQGHRGLAGVALCAGLAACSADDPAAGLGHDALRSTQQAIRPTEADGALGNGWGDVATAYLDSPQGHVRVWYATEGEHEAWPNDVAPADGVPDYVATVAQVGDAVWEHLVDAGFETPLPDDVLHDGVDFGGDARFDIYLVQTNGGDGYLVTEACTTSVPARCAGYIAIENDFWGYGYPSLDVAATVLVSHEIFHAVQAAYTSDVPQWWSEATATWHEHSFVPGQPDAIRLASLFFDEPGRGLNSRSRGPADSFAYGVATFAMFLDEQVGDGAIRGTLERMGTGATAEEAIVEVVEASGVGFDEFWGRFAVATVFTGDRAVDGMGLALAAELPELDAEQLPADTAFDFNVDLDAWATKVAWLDVNDPVDLTLKTLGQGDPLADVWVITPAAWAAGEPATALALDVPLRLGESAWLVATNPDPGGDATAKIAVRAASSEPEGSGEGEGGAGSGEGSGADADGESGSAAGCAASGRGVGGGAGAFGLVWAAALVRSRRRRRGDCALRAVATASAAR